MNYYYHLAHSKHWEQRLPFLFCLGYDYVSAWGGCSFFFDGNMKERNWLSGNDICRVRSVGDCLDYLQRLWTCFFHLASSWMWVFLFRLNYILLKRSSSLRLIAAGALRTMNRTLYLFLGLYWQDTSRLVGWQYICTFVLIRTAC